MSRSDYAHWNEEADRVWWEEEGRHAGEPEYDPDDYGDRGHGALDAFAEECGEMDTGDLLAMLADTGYCARWPAAVQVIENELRVFRGVTPPESKEEE
jgi:hypothetical protein